MPKISVRPRLLTALASSTMLILTSCGAEEETAEAVENTVETSDTLAATISGSDDLSTVAGGLQDVGLVQVFDGAGFYTVLAPQDAAFEKLGETIDFTAEEQRPALAAVLRDHILPGYLTPDDISGAIKAQGGPVEVETMNDHTLSFARSGDVLTVTTEDGVTATLGDATLASNGVAIEVDTVLKDLTPES